MGNGRPRHRQLRPHRVRRALKEGEAAGTRIDSWPAEVRALMDQHVRRWVEENKEARTVRAMTVAAPKHHSIQSCVLILHHSRKG